LAVACVASHVDNACSVTVGDVLGPYYQAGAPTQKGYVCRHSPALDRLRIIGQVQNADCSQGLPATLDVWQANEAGYYSEGASRDSQDYLCRAIIETDERGLYSFITRMPGRYDDGGYRPAHIHFKVTARDGAYDPLVTQLYFVGDTYLGANDSCAKCHSGDVSLQARVVHNADIKTYEGQWNIVLRPRAAGGPRPMSAEDRHDDHYTQPQEHIIMRSGSANAELMEENARLRSALREAGRV